MNKAATWALAIADALNLPVWCRGVSEKPGFDPPQSCASVLVTDTGIDIDTQQTIRHAVREEIGYSTGSSIDNIIIWNDHPGRKRTEVRNAFYRAAMRLGWKP